MRKVKLSWNRDEDGVIAVYATDSKPRTFPVLDIFCGPLVSLGKMTREEAKAFQAFTAERICRAWNSDDEAATIAEEHKIDAGLGLTEWGLGHNAACDQIAYSIRRRVKF